MVGGHTHRCPRRFPTATRNNDERQSKVLKIQIHSWIKMYRNKPRDDHHALSPFVNTNGAKTDAKKVLAFVASYLSLGFLQHDAVESPFRNK